MAERFFVPEIGRSATVALTGEEAHHLTRVRRVKVGESVRVFDGCGIECEAAVSEIGKRSVTLTVLNCERVNRELPITLTLACALPKGDRLRWLVEKATELGVTRFVPLLTNRSTEHARGVAESKLRRWVIEASKQCGRNVLMEITASATWPAFLESCAPTCLCLLADSRGATLALPESAQSAGEVAIAIGPEGGFTESERKAARARGWIGVQLGPRTLRIETAAIVMVARIIAARNSDRDCHRELPKDFLPVPR